MIGFAQSGWLRLAVGAACCLVAVGLVWSVEHGPTIAAKPVEASSATVTRSVRLQVESTYPVAQWTVQVLGVEQSAEGSDAWGWHGTVTLPAGEEVLVLAVADPASPAPHRGLRLRLGDAPERLVWGAGDVAATVSLP